MISGEFGYFQNPGWICLAFGASKAPAGKYFEFVCSSSAQFGNFSGEMRVVVVIPLPGEIPVTDLAVVVKEDKLRAFWDDDVPVTVAGQVAILCQDVVIQMVALTREAYEFICNTAPDAGFRVCFLLSSCKV